MIYKINTKGLLKKKRKKRRRKKEVYIKHRQDKCVSLSPHLHTPFPPFSPSLISRTVSVDIKHHVYVLTCSLAPTHARKHETHPPRVKKKKKKKSSVSIQTIVVLFVLV